MTNVPARDEFGWNALHRAFYVRNRADAQSLLALPNVDPNVKSVRVFRHNHEYLAVGSTCLHIAAYFGAVEFVHLLLAHGDVDIDPRDENGYTPLHLATVKGHTDVVALLLFKGANVDAVANTGDASLHFASMRANVEIIELLVSFGADIECRNTSLKETALLKGAFWFKAASVRLLLALGADTTPTDRFGRSASKTNAANVRQLLADHETTSEQERNRLKRETMNCIRANVGIRLMCCMQPEIIAVCLALSPLELPLYVLLWIIDWLPNYDRLSHRRKIQLLESVRNSIWKLKTQPQQ